MSEDVLTRLRAAAANDWLGIGEAWALLDEAAEALEAQRQLLSDCRDHLSAMGYVDTHPLLTRVDLAGDCERAVKRYHEAIALLRECREKLNLVRDHRGLLFPDLCARLDAALGDKP